MNTTNMSGFMPGDKLVNIGAPLLALVLLSTQYGVGVGAWSTIGAAVLAGVAIPILARFVTQPFLKFCTIETRSITGYAFTGVCNAGVGALCFMATL